MANIAQAGFLHPFVTNAGESIWQAILRRITSKGLLSQLWRVALLAK